MIFSENKKPPIKAFQQLMLNTDNLLNQDALKRENYYANRSGIDLETDVFNALKECSKGTEFHDTLYLISGANFPDIVLGNYYGVEVKSTKQNHWTSIGSSILESTRKANIDKIFLTFGKLGKPIRFISRPYEECLSGISVTHYPRYKIDMELKHGETIFDKIGIPYDSLRKMDNPVVPVSKYYKNQLKEGQSLWWVTDNPYLEDDVPETVKLWSVLSPEEKSELTILGHVLFPEITKQNDNKKYNRYALWLATRKGIVNTNIRDSFSAGGQVLLKDENDKEIKMPAIYGRINKNALLIKQTMKRLDESILKEYWKTANINEDRISQWCEIILKYVNAKDIKSTQSVLKRIFSEIPY